MYSRYLTGIGVLLLVALGDAAAQQPESETDAAQMEQANPETAEPEVPAQAKPEPAENTKTEPTGKNEPVRETSETFVPTEDISEDRSVSFPVDI